jgi:hypothetical protein
LRGLVLGACLLAIITGVALPSASLAAPTSRNGKLLVTVVSPAGVPANVVVHGKRIRVLAKAPKPKVVRFKVIMPAGKIRVTSPGLTFNGAPYAAAGRRAFQLRRGGTIKVRVVFKRLTAARRLRATAVGPDSVSLTWDAPARARVVQLRRTLGGRPAGSVRAGKKVATKGTSADDAGLKSGTKYTYALFTHLKHRWVGPVSVLVGTATSDPGVAAYVVPPSSVIVKPGQADKPSVTGGGVDVALASGRPTPVVGAGFVLPPSDVLPAGYLGKVASVSANGRSVHLVGAGLADVFDFYKINSDLSKLGRITLKPDTRAMKAHAPRGSSPKLPSGLKSCLEALGGSAESNVALHPIIDPSGHFSSDLVKKWGFIPVGATFDVSAQLKVGLTADISVKAAIGCGLPFKKVVKMITVEPVPIALVFDPTAEVKIEGEMSAKNIGYTATGGFWAKGEIGLHNSADAGLIKNAGPTPISNTWGARLTMELGGELTLGPGGGTDDVGAIAGVGGKFVPLKATFGPEFTDEADGRHTKCIKTTIGLESGLNLNAKAWVGDWDISHSFDLPGLQWNHDYAGPWYLPSGCNQQPPDPSSDALGPGVQPVSSSTTGDAAQWGHVDGFAPGQQAWILSTGNMADAAVNDPSSFASTDLGGPGNDALSALVGGLATHDAASYKVVLKPTGHTLHIRYLFASEEYPEYVGSNYDDVMAVFVNGTNCANVPGTNDRVSVNSINGQTNSQYFVDNEQGASGYSTSMDGLTVPLQCDIQVTPGQEITVEVAVADTSDGVYDSAVGLLDNGIWSD